MTSRIDKAKSAFLKNDAEESKLVHDTEDRKEPHKEYIVFGGLDGIITTFAIVAVYDDVLMYYCIIVIDMYLAAAGAGLTRGVVLILGFANLLGDALGMAFGDYVSEKAEEDQLKKHTLELEEKLQNNPDQEKQNLIEIYMKKGYDEQQASRIAELLFPYKTTVTSIMMMEEHGDTYEEGDSGAMKSALVTFGSFMVCGGIPLLAFLCAGGFSKTAGFDLIFIIAIILFSIVLFVLGCFKGYISNKNIPVSGLLMLINGAVTTLAAFFIGYAIELKVEGH
ncbi:hypothetical protein DFA_02586 [Cavenderia fasciculata]|uniref:Transmembrane protein n=1 Tax=Cavenderia fasciculata TaxID=261658 RepID=F4PZT3_CACFS|nr:uncharacterized protein DFA_02586 [Cavenderia fasciculata]EGG18847.1 hypothetical protein DFA_02586 [Cavenderia fasciculata]|eukprot:XP_004357309.1 hypothetical protein DFA_02586 [Cavenderia fasciculata]